MCHSLPEHCLRCLSANAQRAIPCQALIGGYYWTDKSCASPTTAHWPFDCTVGCSRYLLNSVPCSPNASTVDVPSHNSMLVTTMGMYATARHAGAHDQQVIGPATACPIRIGMRGVSFYQSNFSSSSIHSTASTGIFYSSLVPRIAV